jgi:hypothetical protein
MGKKRGDFAASSRPSLHKMKRYTSLSLYKKNDGYVIGRIKTDLEPKLSILSRVSSQF